MEEYKENIDQLEEVTESKGSRSLVKDILTGSILTREVIMSHMGFMLFVTFLGIIYIGNRYHSEKILKGIVTVGKEAKDARAESIITSSELMIWKNQSKIYELSKSKNLGLKPLVDPPKKLELDD